MNSRKTKGRASLELADFLFESCTLNAFFIANLCETVLELIELVLPISLLRIEKAINVRRK